MRIDNALPWLGRTDPSWETIEPTLVRTRDLGFAQSHVSIAGLVKHSGLPQPGHDPRDDYPRVVNLDGELWVVDGAHRVTLALLLSEPRIMVRLRSWPFEP